MIHFFPDLFVDKNKMSGYSPEYTACVAVILYRELIRWNIIIDAKDVDAKKCDFAKPNPEDVPKDYNPDPSVGLNGITCDNGHFHCVNPVYKYKGYNSAASGIEKKKMEIYKVANCVPVKGKEKEFCPHKIQEEIRKSCDNYKFYVKLYRSVDAPDSVKGIFGR